MLIPTKGSQNSSLHIALLMKEQKAPNQIGTLHSLPVLVASARLPLFLLLARPPLPCL